MEETDNHQLNKFEAGDTSWEHSTDMQHIEERLQIRDAEANLENYTPHETATFIATDSGAIYDGDGSSWNPASRAFDSVSTGCIGNDPHSGIYSGERLTVCHGLGVNS